MSNFFLFLFVGYFNLLNPVKQPIVFLTYNIRYDNPADGDNAWPLRRDFLAQQVRFYQPDVAGLQEVLHNQLVFLKQQLPEFGQVGAGRDDGVEAGEYSPIFFRRSRFDSLSSGTFWLSETPDRPSKAWDAALNRICTWVKLRDRSTNRTLWVFNTHFDHRGATARKQSATLILDQIRRLNPQGEPTVLLGDLNAQPSEEPIAVLKTALHDARALSKEPPFGPEGTFNSFRFDQLPGNRIDYVFVNNGFKVNRYAVLTDNRGLLYPSDHFPVFAELSEAF